MATNVSPQYIEAEERHRAATTDQERLEAMQDMLSAVPKHKASEKLQADLKTRIATLRRQMQSRPAAAKPSYDPFHVAKGGAGQVVLIGPPNSGKSMLVATTTGAPVKVAPYPYTTVALAPGMWRWEDVQIQLVDAPPMTPEHVPPGLLGAIRSADAVVIVVDAAGDCLEEVESVLRILAERGVQPVSISRLKLRQAREQEEELSMPPLPGDDATAEADAQAGKLQPIPAVIAANKTDVAGAADNVPVLREIYSDKIEIYPVSAETGEGLGALGKRLWELLALIRIYTKEPGKPVDKERPYTLPIGANVEDLCRLIHRELPGKFKFARIWGDGRFEGAQVHKGEVLRDKDIVEIHS